MRWIWKGWTYGDETSYWAELLVDTFERLCDECIVADVAFVSFDLDAELLADLLRDFICVL